MIYVCVTDHVFSESLYVYSITFHDRIEYTLIYNQQDQLKKVKSQTNFIMK